MKRKELLESPEYWTAKIQIQLYNKVEEYMVTHHLNRVQLAQHLGVSKGYVTQVLNGDFDHRISKLVKLALAVGVVPEFQFKPALASRTSEENVHDTMNSIFEQARAIGKNAMLYSVKDDKVQPKFAPNNIKCMLIA